MKHWFCFKFRPAKITFKLENIVYLDQYQKTGTEIFFPGRKYKYHQGLKQHSNRKTLFILISISKQGQKDLFQEGSTRKYHQGFKVKVHVQIGEMILHMFLVHKRPLKTVTIKVVISARVHFRG